jgi:hypothetical protein
MNKFTLIGCTLCCLCCLCCSCREGIKEQGTPEPTAASLTEGIGDSVTKVTEADSPQELDARGRVAALMADLGQRDDALQSNPLLQGLERPLDIGQHEAKAVEVDMLTQASRVFHKKYQQDNSAEMWVLGSAVDKNKAVQLTEAEVSAYAQDVMQSLEGLNSEVYSRMSLKKLGELAVLTTDRPGLDLLRKQLKDEALYVQQLRDLELGALGLGVDFLIPRTDDPETIRMLRALRKGIGFQTEGFSSMMDFYASLDTFILFEFDNWDKFWDGDEGKVLRSDALRRDYKQITTIIIRNRKSTELFFGKTREVLGKMILKH